MQLANSVQRPLLRRLLRLAYLGASGAGVMLACSSETPMASGDGTSTPPSSSCLMPETGCACNEGSAPAACGRVESRTEDSVICAHGTMACTQGVWGPCVILDGPAKTTTHAITGGPLAMSGVSPQLFGATQPCGAANACNPNCNMFADDPVGLVLEAGLALVDGGLALAPPGASDGGGDAGCTTTISGSVWDPGLNLRLAGVSVFEPAGTMTTLPTGKACDTCTTLQSSAMASTVTGADGSFTLTGVTPGGATRIVVQSGRWRREVQLNVTACTNNNGYPNDTFRLPRDQADGVSANIPEIAVVTGRNESLACLLRKIGISASEFKGRGTAGAGHIELVRDTGMETSPASSGFNSLFNTAGQLDAYSAVLFECNGSSSGHVYTATEAGNVKAYADTGGRVFMDHVPARELIQGNGSYAGTTLGFGAVTDEPPSPAWGWVSNATAPQALFRNWLANQGLSYAGWVRSDQPFSFIRVPTGGPDRVLWIAGENGNDWGAGAPPGAPSAAADYSLSYSFETPTGGTCAGGGNGRVIYNGMHVSPSRSSNNAGAFPGDCTNGPLTEEEIALEYQFFQLTACALGGPPPPPPPPNLVPQTFSREYRATCGVGQCVAWKYFSWQSIIPPSTSIDFEAQTAPDASGVPGTYGPAVPIGTANATTPGWTWDSCTVDGHLRNLAAAAPPIPGCTGVAPAQQSQEWLKVNMTLNPAGPVSPILTQWRQMYDCVPCE